MTTLGGEPQDLMCTLCREVYRSPRFLTGCYHCFCCQCIASHARAMDSPTFPCPVCRLETTLPEGGASELQVNFYFKEEVLAEARRLLNRNCFTHPENEVDRVCMTCKVSACKRCKQHEGEGHQIHVLSSAEERLQAQVKDLEDRLSFNRLELLNVQAKTSSQSRMLRQQRTLLHAKVEQQFKVNNKALWAICRKGSEKLSEEISFLHEELGKSRSLLDLSKGSVEGKSGLSVVQVAWRTSQRLKSKKDLTLVRSIVPVVHPGLVCSTHDNVEHALSCFLGRPVEHTLPEHPQPPPASVEDVKVPVKIKRPKEVREILSLTPSDDGSQLMFSFRGDPAHLYSSVALVQVQDGAVLSADHDTLQARAVCTFQRYSKKDPRQPVILQTSHFGVFLVSKMEPRLCLFRDKLGLMRVHELGLHVQLEQQPYSRQIPVTEPDAATLLMHLQDATDPFCMDSSSDGQYCVIIDRGQPSSEASAQPSPASKKRKLENGTGGKECVVVPPEGEKQKPAIPQPPWGGVVKLFRKGQSKPVDSYRPAEPSFLPSDVCFCRWRKKRLLVADWQNDEIHVVHVGKRGFRFKRLLAERHGEVVKPSALNTDAAGGVWIGCSNGSVLHFPPKS